MRRVALVAAVTMLPLLVSACALETVDNIKQTASGALDEAQLVRQRAGEKVTDAQRRINDVSEGLQKINEGQQQFRRGLTGSGS